MTEDFDDFYDLMGLDEDASQEEVKSAFREKVREYHPDLNDDERAQAQFTALKTAYDTLGNPSERNAYDRMGHEDYVVKRTKGLPSQDVWSSSPSSSSADSSPSASTSGSDAGKSSSGSTGSRRSSSRTGSSSSRTSSSSRSSGGSSSRSSGTTSSQSSSGTASRSSTSGSSGSSSDSSSGASSAGGTSTTGTTGATASARASTSTSTGTSSGSTTSTSSTTSAGRATASSSATGSYGGTSTSTATTDPGEPGLLDRLLGIKIGWPGIAVANGLYLVGAALFALANLDSLRAFGSALATAETATIRSAALADPATAFETYLYGTDYVAATEIAAPAVVLVAGAALLPLVYGVVVRRTRRSSIPWDPTWLYVLCTLGPLAGVALNLVGYAYVGADLALFLALPFLSVLALPLSAFVRPFVKRVFFA